jgi:hypothetical protein
MCAQLLVSEHNTEIIMFAELTVRAIGYKQAKNKNIPTEWYNPIGITDQHYALIITPLFITPAPTWFGTYMPSSGSILYPYELLERQKWLCCGHVL